MKEWSNLAKVVYKRTYARHDKGPLENWEDTVKRIIDGNTKIIQVSQKEKDRLFYYISNRKAMPAGRGLWFSGSPAHDTLHGAGLVNCWAFTGDDWKNLVMAQDLLMLGGGVGLSIEHKYVSKLPKVKRNVKIEHLNTKDADFIVPDSRQGWCRLTNKILTSFFESGESFTFSTICVRGAGEEIKGFGGKSSGPRPLVDFASKICSILANREGTHLRTIDLMDLLCSIGELVVSGNVRRSALLILGDPWDKDYLKSKRWDLGVIPTQRAMANLSVNCSDIDDLHPLFWKTYEHGEPFGIVNIKNIQKYARMGELKKDTAQCVNPCSEATLEDGEPCNLTEIFLPNLDSEDEFLEAAKLMHRWSKRVTCEEYHHPKNDEVIKRNRRVGTGITGCLQSELFKPEILDRAYSAIQDENKKYSKELGIPESIRTTVIKPSGTVSLLGDCTPGIHPSFSKYYIRRVRFSSNDNLVPLLKNAGHKIEPVQRFDGTIDNNTLVVDFYCETPEGTPVANENWDTWKQLEILKMAQKHWADQAVSVTVYYKREDIPKLKLWLEENLKEIKTISFLCHNDHGFKQAPIEALTKEEFETLSKNIKPLNVETINNGFELDSLECASGACPIK